MTLLMTLIITSRYKVTVNDLVNNWQLKEYR